MLLNDVQFVEAARVLAERAWSAGGGDAEASVAFRIPRVGRVDSPTTQKCWCLWPCFNHSSKLWLQILPQRKRLLQLGRSREMNP